mgnify:CR=1 FL=1|tara:strand:- start:361 stop:1122 length:762 start_codon:yes stop_codon:yes gene_type:complete
MDQGAVIVYGCLWLLSVLPGCTQSAQHVYETDPFETSRRALAQRVLRHTLDHLKIRIQSAPKNDSDLSSLLAELKDLQRAQSDAGSIRLNQQIEKLVLIAQERLGLDEAQGPEKSNRTPPSFSTPIDQGRISSAFGMRQDPFNTGKVIFHNGVDFAAERGTPVVASADGHVIQAGFRGDGCGLTVSILHEGDFVSDYCHLSRIHVVMMSRVRKGMMIGRVGSTGRASGPHLHWVIWHHGVAVDPIRLAGQRDL